MGLSKFLSRPKRAATLARAATRLRARGGLMAKIGARLIVDRLAAGYGIYLSPVAAIGEDLALPHPVGIVIGDGVRIGDGVTIYQNVTIGRRNATFPDYPVVENGSTIFAGAVVAGAVRIGRNATVGANAVVISDVPDGATVVGVPARILS